MVSAPACVSNFLSIALNLIGTNFSKHRCRIVYHLARSQKHPKIDHLIDSFPVMLAPSGHAYSGRVAVTLADVGYCAAKKTYFHGVRLHCIAERRFARLPNPSQIWVCGSLASRFESRRQQFLELPNTT